MWMMMASGGGCGGGGGEGVSGSHDGVSGDDVERVSDDDKKK
jgi:hypothetical protein